MEEDVLEKIELLKQFSKDKEYIFYSAKEYTHYEKMVLLSEKFLGKAKKFDSWEAIFEYF